MNLKELLKGDLSEKEIGLLKRSFDQIGSIAQLEIPPELESKEKIIASKVLSHFKNIKTVVKKATKTEGPFRIRKVEVLAGEKTTETVHKENGIVLKLDLNKVFYTPRLSGERLRVLGLVKEGDIVADLFCGVGPYSILIAKKSKCSKVIANDLNPDAYNFLLENIKLNKVNNIEPYNKDAREFSGLNADIVILNIPKYSEDFLDVGFNNCKVGGIIVYYTFATEEEIKDKIAEIERNNPGKVVRYRKCGDIGPRVYRWALDIERLGE